jgi:tetratricopeptide (TPR) repeat protein
MIRVRSFPVAVLVLVLAAGTAFASWYDDYDAGIAAARKGQWPLVVQKMSAAIAGNAKESNNARTYGAIFINYHPYYYRGIANMNLGKYEQAIADFEKTSGPGEFDLGSLDSLMQRAKSKLEAANAPEPQTPVPAPVPVPVPSAPRPVPVQPAAPSIDAGLRQRASAEIEKAKGRLAAAQQRRATGSPQYAQALQQITTANTQLATAKSNDDLNAVIAAAGNAALLADSALAPNVPAPPPGTSPAVPTRPTAAAETVLADYRGALRAALANYFAGEFDDAARGFEELTRKLPNNGWVWAFLGASQYSQYAFEADEGYKKAAIASFKNAKRYRSWKGGLPDKYFSKRIRKFFETVG